MQTKWIKIVFLTIFIIAVFICIALTSSSTRRVTIAESILNDIILLPQKIYTYSKAYLTSNDGFFVEIEEIKQENKELKQRVEELENKLADYEYINAENEVLKKHANLTDEYSDYTVIGADIISDSATNWEATYIVNKGSKDGVTPGMTVIAENGLVGYVKSVTKSTSKIVSILDAGNSVSGRVSRTRDAIVCKGSLSLAETQELRVMNIPLGTTLIEGDKIETSGLGGVYPKGINIGKVVKVINKSNPAENEAIIKVDVDFNKLETVAIIVMNEDMGENIEGENNE